MSNEKLQADVKSVLLDVDAQRLTVEAAQKKISSLYAGWLRNTLKRSLPGPVFAAMISNAAAVLEGA